MATGQDHEESQDPSEFLDLPPDYMSHEQHKDTHDVNYGLQLQHQAEYNNNTTARMKTLRKPHLKKNQEDILEAFFQGEPRPSSMVERQLAVLTKLSRPRITDWFQNRRAMVKLLGEMDEFQVDMKLANATAEGDREKSSALAPITPRAERDLSLLVNGYVYKSIRLRRKDGPVRKKSIESTDDDDGASRKPFFTKNREGADKTQGNDKTDTTTTPRTQMLHSASTSNASHAVKHVDMIFSASSSNKRRELNDEVGIPSAEWAVKQPMRTVSIPSGKDFRFYEGYQSDLTPLQDLHLSSERSNSSTDVSTIDSDSERSFVASTAAAPRIVSVDTEALLLIMGKGLALKVLEGFLSTFPGTTSATTDTSSRRGASQVSIVAAVSESRALQGNTPAAKRSADSRDDSEDADEDDRGNTKRQRRTAPSSGSAKLLLACPYFKLDPVRYSERNVQERCYRGCASSLLRNIPRLKQHLYRVHRRPEYYCGRCYVSFDTQALANMHSRQNQSCTVVEPQFEEKMDNDQMNAIKRRNRRVNPPAEWYSIFKILFPDSSLPASPYADRSSTELLQNFMSYFQEEAPSIISEHVRTALNGRIFLSEQTQDLLDETFEQAVSQLLLGFEARLEDMDAFPGTGEEVIREHTTDSTTSLNRLTPGSNAGDAAQDFLGHGNSIDPSDFLFGVASDSWLETNFFD